MKTITMVGLLLVAGAAGAQPPGGGGGLTFDGLDADKNGSLSQDEIAKFFAGRPAGPNGAPNAAEIFGRWDANKDGSVSKAEFDARPRPGGGGGGGPPGGQAPG
ncbi:MAG TPA: EF-hand domain-containing protein [Gammaproteobacteria bacterium]|nr:EF-hand domain-containing protein [Gammaproteobacteria bacterium]